jgi:hypothetical protein
VTELREKVLDSFEDLSGWKAITSGQAALRISQDQGFKGKAMRLDLVDGYEVGVENLPTYYGKISWSLRVEEPAALRLTLKGDLFVPAGGILVKPL